jgi:hypothetical protein
LKSKNEILEKQLNSLNNKNLSLEKKIIKLEIESQDSLEKRKVNDVETSSLNTQDSNLLLNENKRLKLKIEDLTKTVINLTNGNKKLG